MLILQNITFALKKIFSSLLVDNQLLDVKKYHINITKISRASNSKVKNSKVLTYCLTSDTFKQMLLHSRFTPSEKARYTR